MQETQTSADLLQNSGTVFVQKSQLGGGSPVIRGFEASRVLLVVDGVRMNNAIYRAGHLQDIITVDQNAMERVEVISGPASVVYGSDALGGVVHFTTRSPRVLQSDGRTAIGDGFLRYSSANQEKTAHAGIELRGKEFSSFTSITVSDFDDLRQGATRDPFLEDFGRRPWYVERVNGIDSALVNDDSNVQVGSAYRQLDLLQKVRYQSGEHTAHELNLQFSTSDDVPRYDRLTQGTQEAPRFAEWYYGPQQRFLAAYTFSADRRTSWYDRIRVTPSFQAIEQSRNSRRYRMDERTEQLENVDVFALNVDMEKRSGKNEFRYGLEGWYNDVTSTARNVDIITGASSPAGTRYADGGADMSSLAAYVSHTGELSEKWVVSEGVRFTTVGLNATFVDSSYSYLVGTTSQRNAAVSGKLAAMFLPGKAWRISALGSSGFRAPNVDDLSKVFDSAPGLVIVPNPELKPEITYNAELGVSKTIAGLVTIEGNAYYTWYRDALAVGSSTFNGQDSIDYDGVLSKVVSMNNAGKAYLYGGFGQITAQLGDHFVLRSSLTYTYGRIVTDSMDLPLDHIPPVFGRTGLEIIVKRLRGEVYLLYNGWKRLQDYGPTGEDNLAFATPYGMPEWYTLNARATYAVNDRVSAQMGLENIADRNYRTFSSNISAAGRNFTVSLRATF